MIEPNKDCNPKKIRKEQISKIGVKEYGHSA